MVCQKTKGSANVLISPVCEVANSEHNASNCLENNNSKESCLDADSDNAEKNTTAISRRMERKLLSFYVRLPTRSQ